MRLRLAFAVVVLAFAASRLALWWGVAPFFDVDTYKYLSGADSLWAGGGWSPIYLHRHEGGGALHAVPGYPWFLLAVWGVAGERTFTGVALAQAIVSTLALVATADLVRRRYGPWVALAAAGLLALSPALAWLDHFLMPESLSASLLVLAMWLAAQASKEGVFDGRAMASALAAGVLVGFVVLLRTSAQVFVPFPLVVAAFCLRRTRATALWGVVYVAGFYAGVLPWIVHNYQEHGRAVVAASTGRSLYFAGVWTDTIDRDAQMSKFAPGRATDANSAFFLLDAQYQAFLDRGLDLVAADDAMRGLAIAEMRSAGLSRFVRGRAQTLGGLFETHSFGRKNNDLREMVGWYLRDGGGHEPVLGNMQKRWGYQLSSDALRTMDETHRTHPGPGLWFQRWVEWLCFDNQPLAVAFLASTLVLVARPRRHAFALACWVAPVYAYLVMYSIFGTPLYRYQAVIHGPMLVAIAIALAELARLAGTRFVRT